MGRECRILGGVETRSVGGEPYFFYCDWPGEDRERVKKVRETWCWRCGGEFPKVTMEGVVWVKCSKNSR